MVSPFSTMCVVADPVGSAGSGVYGCDGGGVYSTGGVLDTPGMSWYGAPVSPPAPGTAYGLLAPAAGTP